ncbi:MAG: hypothetical protein AAF799_16785 [Myxococcota bacterium]
MAPKARELLGTIVVTVLMALLVAMAGSPPKPAPGQATIVSPLADDSPPPPHAMRMHLAGLDDPHGAHEGEIITVSPRSYIEFEVEHDIDPSDAATLVILARNISSPGPAGIHQAIPLPTDALVLADYGFRYQGRFDELFPLPPGLWRLRFHVGPAGRCTVDHVTACEGVEKILEVTAS